MDGNQWNAEEERLQNFLLACVAAKVPLTHILCVGREGILAEYVQPPYTMDTLRICYSMTKSVTSLAVGAAVGKGLLSLDDLVGDILPECMPEDKTGNVWRIRVRDLLTMSGGIEENTYGVQYHQKDWVKAYLYQEFPRTPGTHYLYSTHGTHVLAAVVERVSGQGLDAFLNENLFCPMGIFEAQWEHTPSGCVAGGMGLSLFPTSLAKLSRVLLNGGEWQGKQLIPADYLKAATTRQITKQDESSFRRFSGDGYGYQFHVGENGFFRMYGAFGQVCLICPARNLAFVALSGGAETETLLRLLYTHFLEEPLPLLPIGVWKMAENPLEIRTLTLIEGAGAYHLQCAGEHNFSIRFVPGDAVRGHTSFIKDLEWHGQAYVVNAVWNGELTLTVQYIETPYTAKYRLVFSGNKLRLKFEIDQSFTLENFSVTGTRG